MQVVVASNKEQMKRLGYMRVWLNGKEHMLAVEAKLPNRPNRWGWGWMIDDRIVDFDLVRGKKQYGFTMWRPLPAGVCDGLARVR